MELSSNIENDQIQIKGSDAFQNAISDPEIWTRFCNGDDQAFAHIYKKHIQELYNFGFQLSRDKELTKDIIQDLFIRLRFSKSQIKIKSVKSYLYKCFYNDWIKKAKLDANSTSLVDERLAITISFEDRLIQKQLDEAKIAYLNKALSSLTFKQRKAITLFFYEGFSYVEVAEAMSLKNAKSARKIVYRAIDKLKPDEAVMNILYSFLL